MSILRHNKGIGIRNPLLERRTAIAKKPSLPKLTSPHLERLIVSSLDAQKAEDIVSVNLSGKADFADSMVIASGTSQRHVASLASRVVEALKAIGLTPIPVEGQEPGDWVLVDAGNVVVHLFHPETRRYYNLEKMWSVGSPDMGTAH